jgi:hypothetical protein
VLQQKYWRIFFRFQTDFFFLLINTNTKNFFIYHRWDARPRCCFVPRDVFSRGYFLSEDVLSLDVLSLDVLSLDVLSLDVLSLDVLSLDVRSQDVLSGSNVLGII